MHTDGLFTIGYQFLKDSGAIGIGVGRFTASQ
jgi:hypothetical protein